MSEYMFLCRVACFKNIIFISRFGDQVYSEPNRTMMSYTEGVLKQGKEKGFKKEVMCTFFDVIFFRF